MKNSEAAFVYQILRGVEFDYVLLNSRPKSISAHYCISYRNQLFDLQCKSNNGFLYEMQHVFEVG